MLKNKIMALAIGIFSFAVVGNSQTLLSDAGPAELPPASFKGKQYVDSKGCVYIRAGYGTRITWVPRVNRARRVFCSPNNKPSLSPAQLAAISGQPATRLVKPVAATAAPKAPKKTVRTAAAVAPKKVRSTTNIWGQRTTPQTVHPSDTVRQDAPPIQGGTSYNIASASGQTTAPVLQGGTAYNIEALTPERARPKKSVRGYSLFDRRRNRDAIRTGPQAVQPAEVIRAEQSGETYQQAKGAGARSTDPIHNLPVYKTTIASDVTPRGDAQMAQIWTNTVPRKLLKKGRVKLVVSTMSYTASTKSQDYTQDSSLR